MSIRGYGEDNQVSDLIDFIRDLRGAENTLGWSQKYAKEIYHYRFARLTGTQSQWETLRKEYVALGQDFGFLPPKN